MVEKCPEIVLKFSKQLVLKFYFVLLGPLYLIVGKPVFVYTAAVLNLVSYVWLCQGRRVTFTVGYSKVKQGVQHWLYFNVFRKSDLWQDINDAILLFYSAKIDTFWAIKCVSIQNSTYTFQLLRSAAAKQHVGAHSADSCYSYAAAECKHSSWVLNIYTFIAQKVAIFH